MKKYIIIFLFSIHYLHAQHADSKPISLENAIEICLKNNLSIQTQKLKISQQEALEGTAIDFAKTNLGTEIGQINSRAIDSKLMGSQAFRPKNYYRAQDALLKAKTAVERQGVDVVAYQVKAEIYPIFAELLFLQAQKALYLRYDTLYAKNLKVAETRIRLGESGILEKTTAETQRLQISHDILQTEVEILYWQEKLQYWLQTKDWFFPENQPFKMSFSFPADSNYFQKHPALRALQQQIALTQQQIKAEEAEFLPEFTVGLGMQSIRGYQNTSGTEYYAGALPQFAFVQAGISIPIYKKAINSRIESVKIQEKVIENEQLVQSKQIQYEYDLLASQYKKAVQHIAYYEKVAIPQGEKLLKTAELSRQNGEIGYAEWSLTLNQVMAIQQEYLNAIRGYNQIVVALQSLLF